MKNIFIEYPKCSTCKKAKKWLEENNIEFIDRNIVEETPTVEELTEWIQKSEEELKKNREKSLEEGETQAKKEMAYELYHEEGFTIERIAKLVKIDQKIVEEWLLQK